MKTSLQTKKIGDITQICLGLTHTPHYVERGVPFLSVTNITGEKIDFSRTRYVSEEEFNSMPYGAKPKIGDVLFCRVGTIGSPKILEEDIKFGIFVSLGFFRPNLEFVFNRYLYYWVMSSSFEKQVYDNVQGGVLKNLNTGWLKNFEIPLPPLKTQKEIVAKLDEKMTKIKEVRKLRTQALSETEKILYQTLHEIFEEGKQNGWEEVEFGNKEYLEIIDGDRGKNYPTKAEFTTEGYCLFLSTSNVRKGNFDFSRMDFIKKEKDESLRKGKVSRGDLILTTRGTLGNSAYYDDSIPYENIRINSGMVVLRTDKNKLLPQYLIYIINSDEFIKKTKEANSGSAQPQLPIKVLSKLNFLVPSTKEQEKIVKRLDELSAKIRQAVELQKSQLEDLKKLEKSYLREAFNGELV